MAEHRGRRRSPWWKLRNEYDLLRRAHAELERRYRALEADHVVLVGDLEQQRYGVPVRHVPSWARDPEDETQELPQVPLAPADAAELVLESGLLESPSGSLGQREGTTG